MHHLRFQLQTMGGWVERRNWNTRSELAKDKLLCIYEGNKCIISLCHHILSVFKTGAYEREKVKEISDLLSSDTLNDKSSLDSVFETVAAKLRESMSFFLCVSEKQNRNTKKKNKKIIKKAKQKTKNNKKKQKLKATVVKWLIKENFCKNI